MLTIERYGKPVALYSDKYGVFKINTKEAKSGTGFTQFGRAMEHLGIELICADSPQAKGRVERANATLQDRLVKELRLAGISDMNSGNQFLDKYMEEHNSKFAVTPRDSIDAHKACHNLKNLTLDFTIQTSRKIQKNLTFQYKNKTYAIEVPGKGYRLRQATVTVCEAESGEITILHNQQSLGYKVYDTQQQYCEAVPAKELESRMQTIKARTIIKPTKSHPWNQQVTIAALKKQQKNTTEML